VVREVHGRPPQPHGVEHVDREELGEQMSHEQGLESRPSGVERGKSAKDDWRGVEARGIQINTKKLVNCLETRGVSSDGVVGRCQAVCVLVPWRRAGKDGLDQHSRDIHVAESACPRWCSARRSPDEHAAADNDRRHIVDNSVWQPGEEIKDYVLVRGENVAQVGAVEYVLEGREDAHPNGRSVVGGNISASPTLASLYTRA
jgi:hypothetical protein